MSSIDSARLKAFCGILSNEIDNEKHTMPRRRSALATKTSRAELPYSDAPEWEVISPGVRLGYRRGRGTAGRGGSWLAAARGPDGKRAQAKLGRADDIAVADGASVLSHEDAKSRAREWATEVAKGRTDQPPAPTVNFILDQYFAAKEADGMKSIDDARTRAALHIRSKLGQKLVTDLTAEAVRQWRDGMVTEPARRRSKKFGEPNIRVVDLKDPEVLRQRRDTANRNLTILKAALNWARDQQLVADDTAWRLAKPFKGTTASRIRFLDKAGQTVLLGNCTGALRDLVAAALVTGARFSELARLGVGDFDPDNGSIFVSESKSGRSRHVPLPPGGVALFVRIAKGRGGNSYLLAQDNGEPWRPTTYWRAFNLAVKTAGLEKITLHELRHTYASTMVRGGAPLMVVAQALGHTDTRMVERHYAHLAPSYVSETIRRLAPDIDVA